MDDFGFPKVPYVPSYVWEEDDKQNVRYPD